MSKIGDRNGTPEEMRTRGDTLRDKIMRSGLSFKDFEQEAELSRNQVYRLLKGQKPTAEQEARILVALRGALKPDP